jgi:hypothetical protein
MVCEVASIVALLHAGTARRALTAAKQFFVSFLLLSRRTALKYTTRAFRMVLHKGFKLDCPLFSVLLPSMRDNFRIPIDQCIWIKIPWKNNADSASTIV